MGSIKFDKEDEKLIRDELSREYKISNSQIQDYFINVINELFKRLSPQVIENWQNSEVLEDVEKRTYIIKVLERLVNEYNKNKDLKVREEVINEIIESTSVGKRKSFIRTLFAYVPGIEKNSPVLFNLQQQKHIYESIDGRLVINFDSIIDNITKPRELSGFNNEKIDEKKEINNERNRRGWWFKSRNSDSSLWLIKETLDMFSNIIKKSDKPWAFLIKEEHLKKYESLLKDFLSKSKIKIIIKPVKEGMSYAPPDWINVNNTSILVPPPKA